MTKYEEALRRLDEILDSIDKPPPKLLKDAAEHNREMLGDAKARELARKLNSKARWTYFRIRDQQRRLLGDGAMR